MGWTPLDISILYVEDNQDIREEVENFLSLRCREVFVAANGIEGAELFRKVRPDIVITDVMMPKMTGFEMIEALQKDFGKFPTIVMTAFRNSDANMECLEALGIDHTLSKPVDIQQLLQKIEYLLA